jgi:PAS domain S-box-containing protein
MKTKKTETEVLRPKLASAEEKLNALLKKETSHGSNVQELVNTQEALRESEEKYHRIVETSNEGIWSVDKDGKTTFVNKKMSKMLGYTQQELIGRKITEFLEKNKDENEVLNLEKLKNAIELKFVRKDGSLLWVLTSAVPIFDKNNNLIGTFSMNSDITERKKVEQSLKYQADILSRITDVVYSTDLQLCITSWNHAAEEAYGWKEKEVLGRNIIEVTCSEFDPEMRAHLARVLAKSGPAASEIEHKTRTGKKIIFESNTILLHGADGNPSGFIIVNRDITERKRAEEELRLSENRFRLALQNAPVTIAAQDLNLKFIWVYNQKTRSPIEVIGKSDYDIFPPDIAEQLVLLKKKVIKSGKELREQLWVTSNNIKLFLDLYIEPTKDADGIINGIEIATVDLTDIKVTQEALETVKLNVVNEKNRLEAIMEALPVGIAILNSEGGEITSNLAFGHIWGEKRPTAKDIRDYAEFKAWYADTDKPVLSDEWASAIALHKGETVTGQIFRIQNFDGTCAYIHNNAAPIKDINGNITGCVVAIQDISNNMKTIEELKQLEETLRFTMESIGDGFFACDKDWKIIYLNTKAERILSIRMEEVIGQSYWDIFPLTQGTQLEKDYRLAAAGETRDFINYYETSGRWFHSRCYPRKGGGMSVFFEDITERKNMEVILEKNNHKINEILNSIQDDFYVLDKNWNFIYASRVFTSKIGMEPEDFIGKNIWEMFPKHIGTIFEKNLRTSMEKREIIRFEIGGKYTDAWYTMTVFPSEEGITVLGNDITVRKRIEETLRESEGRFRTIAETLPVFISIGSIDDGKILYLNEAYNQAFGFNSGDMIGRDSPDLYVNPEDRRRLIDTLKKQGIAKNLELMVKKHDGTPFWISSTVMPVIFEGKSAMIAASIDISERKKLESELNKNNILLQGIIDGASSAIFIKDTAFRFITINKRLEEMMGMKKESIIGKTDYDIFPADVADIYRKNDNNILETGKMRQLEEEADLADGHHFFLSNKFPLFDDMNKIYAIAAISLDISDLKRTEELLRQSEVKYAAAFSNNSAAIALTTLDDGLFIDVNETWVSLMGYKRDDVIGLSSRTMNIWPNPEAAKRFTDELKEKGLLWGWEQEFFNKSGQIFIAEISATLLTVQNRQTILTTMIDITERKRNEEVLQTTLQRLHTLVSSMHVGILLVGEHKTEMANQAFCDYFSLREKPEEIIGLTPDEIIDKIRNSYPDQDHAINRINEIVRIGKPVIGEEITLIGGRSYLRDFIPIFVNGKSYGRMWYHMDITEQKKVEEKLRETQIRTSIILEGIADTYYSLDSQWRFTVVNPAAERAPFGRPAAELLGKNIWELYPDLVGTRIYHHYIEAANKRIMIHYTAQSPLNSLWYEVFMQGWDGGVDVYMRDITDRKKAEEAVRLSEERFRHLAESAFEGLLVHHDGVITDVNTSLVSMIGYQRDEIIGRIIIDFVDPAYHDLMRKQLIVHKEIEIIHRDGTRIPVEVMVKQFIEKDSLIAAIRDIRERKKAEEELIKTNGELARFNRAAVDRELRIIELKKEVNVFCVRSGLKPEYPLDFEKENL